MTHVTFQAHTPEELKQKIMAFVTVFNMNAGDVPSQPNLPGFDKSEGENKKTRARKSSKNEEPKTEEAPPAEAPAETQAAPTPAQEAAPATAPAPSLKEIAMAKLTDLVNKKSVEVARDLLQKFGAGRFSEMKEEHYQNFINEAEALTK